MVMVIRQKSDDRLVYRSRYGWQPSALRNHPALQGFHIHLLKFLTVLSIQYAIIHGLPVDGPVASG